jgi:protoporphyrinogen/coproporphyrinogen III oxidase
MKKLFVIGGGIAGLSAAWHASRAGGVQITLVERGGRLGGKIRTDLVDGFILEQGPDSFLTNRPEAVRLSEELGISGRLVSRTPRPVHALIMHRHALFPLPDGFSGMVPMDTAALAVSPLLSEAGKRRAMEEPSMPAWTGGDDESVASFMVRRFGEEAFQLFVEPLFGGIHAGDAALLSLEAASPYLRRMEKSRGSISGQAASPVMAPDSEPRAPFLTFPRGTGEMVSALEQKLEPGVTILRETEAESVRREGGRFLVELSGGGREKADALIIATPAHETARLVGPLDPALREMLRLIPFASTVVIHLAYRRAEVDHPLDGYGYLIPSVENSDLVACTWSSQKWDGRAPADTILLRLSAGRFGRRDLLGKTDEELFALARAELAATLKITAPPVLQRLHRWDMGMPQYTVGHLRRVGAIDAGAASIPGLFLAGASYGGVGIPQCIASGAAAAAAALGFVSKAGGRL